VRRYTDRGGRIRGPRPFASDSRAFAWTVAADQPCKTTDVRPSDPFGVVPESWNTFKLCWKLRSLSQTYQKSCMRLQSPSKTTTRSVALMEILDELRDLKQSTSRLGLTQTERYAQSVMQSRSLGRWESQDKAAVLTFVNALSVTTGSK